MIIKMSLESDMLVMETMTNNLKQTQINLKAVFHMEFWCSLAMPFYRAVDDDV